MARKIKTDIAPEKEISLQIENSIRPQNLDQYIGQRNIKENLKVGIAASKVRNSSLDHILLSGPPGLGKTSLAHVIAKEMQVQIKTVNAPVIEKTGEIAAILASLNEGDILFVDEIHRLPKTVEEMLYSAMEDYKIEILVGSMEQTKVITMDLPKFTLIGATTREGLLSKPLLDRFHNKFHFTYYENEDLATIIKNTSIKLETPMEDEIGLMLAKMSRGTPRIANNLTKKYSDYLLATGKKQCKTSLESAMNLAGIDEHGLNELDREYLSILKDVFVDKPVGLNTIAAYLGESEDTIKDNIEPYLLRKKWIIRTPSGRLLNKEIYNAEIGFNAETA